LTSGRLIIDDARDYRPLFQIDRVFGPYDVQIAEGNVIERLRNNIDHIGQIHFADVPGRHEPGTGEIHFRNVFRVIYELGDRYRGYVTAEYHPTDLSFRDLERVKQLATVGPES